MLCCACQGLRHQRLSMKAKEVRPLGADLLHIGVGVVAATTGRARGLQDTGLAQMDDVRLIQSSTYACCTTMRLPRPPLAAPVKRCLKT